MPARRQKPPDEHVMEREHRFPLADGRTLACLALGDPGGSPVLYFHGYPGSRLEGRLAADAARRLGLRLLAPDRPGFGESTFQPGRTIGAWAADVAELAARLVRRHPDLYLAHMMTAAPSADREVLADPVYRALFAESTAESLRQGGRGVAGELPLLARPWDFSLLEVPIPVRIWQGLADNIVPAAMARHLAAALPHSEPHYLPDEGHLSLIVRHLDAVLAELCP